MQRGARITLAAAILLAGATAAMMFRRDRPSGESTASAEPSALQGQTGGTPPFHSVAPHLAGRIEIPQHASDDFTSPAVGASAPLVALPPPPATPGTDGFSSDNRPGASPQSPRTHKIRDGDTLSELARRYLGRRERFMEIFAANRDKLTSPDLLPIGKELLIPPQDQGPPSQSSSLQATVDPADARPLDNNDADPNFAAPGVIRPALGPTQPPRIYRVQDEETLVQVSERVYGNAEKYRDLYEANRDRLDSPQNLRPGMVLVVP